MDSPVKNSKPTNKTNSTLDEGDTIGLTGEVTHVHDDGKVTIRLSGTTIR